MKQFIKMILRKILPIRFFDLVAFIYIFKRIPNRSNSIYFNEKVFLRKHYDINYLYTLCSDKSKVREYIKFRIGDEYLIPLILDTDKPEEVIELRNLERAVIKLNTGAGMNVIQPNIKNTAKKIELLELMKNWMVTDYSALHNEPHYKKINKRIVVEESICIGDKVPTDYKFHCFKQKDDTVQFVLQFVNGRFHNESRGYFKNDLDICVHSHGAGHHKIPENDKLALKEIIRLNQILAQDFNYVRIDWFVSNGQPYFGELTFTPGGGLSAEFGEELEKYMCEMWVL